MNEFDFNDLIGFFRRRLRGRWRMPTSDIKEKWGELRVYTSFGIFNFHQLIWPGYAFCQYGRVFGDRIGRALWRADMWLSQYVLRPANAIMVPVHQAAYRRAYRDAVRRWPEHAGLICGAADWPELLEGVYDYPKCNE